MTPEGKLKAYFRKRAKEEGLAYINLIATGDDGWPDKILLPFGGPPIFVEFKTPQGQFSDAQQQKCIFLQLSGYEYWTVRSKGDVEHIIAWSQA